MIQPRSDNKKENGTFKNVQIVLLKYTLVQIQTSSSSSLIIHNKKRKENVKHNVPYYWSYDNKNILFIRQYVSLIQ